MKLTKKESQFIYETGETIEFNVDFYVSSKEVYLRVMENSSIAVFSIATNEKLFDCAVKGNEKVLEVLADDRG